MILQSANCVSKREKRPFYGLLSRRDLIASRRVSQVSVSSPARRATGEKFASCQSAYQSGFEVMVAVELIPSSIITKRLSVEGLPLWCPLETQVGHRARSGLCQFRILLHVRSNT